MVFLERPVDVDVPPSRIGQADTDRACLEHCPERSLRLGSFQEFPLDSFIGGLQFGCPHGHHPIQILYAGLRLPPFLPLPRQGMRQLDHFDVVKRLLENQ